MISLSILHVRRKTGVRFKKEQEYWGREEFPLEGVKNVNQNCLAVFSTQSTRYN